MTTLARRTKEDIARPLKVLVPLIQAELDSGDRAGIEHYRRAGEMLLEAKEQMPYGGWGKWLSKNFKSLDGRGLSHQTAARYMELAKLVRRDSTLSELGQSKDATAGHGVGGGGVGGQSYTRLIGQHRDQVRAEPHYRPLIQAARELDADLFAQARQNQEDEVKLHRELAEELVDIGYKALATRLHPDRGGSKEAMTRLNRVREQLQTVAKMRRFV